MILVVDTGPLIALAKIRRMSLLRELGWQTLFIPPMVKRELLGKSGPESEEIDAALDSFIQVAKPNPTDPQVDSAVASLDEGEKQAIALAISLPEKAVLLMDDKTGRTTARNLGLVVTGTIGLLMLAKKRGLIEQIFPILQELRQRGYWLSDGLVVKARQLSGE
jgi:uncharacterized protein